MQPENTPSTTQAQTPTTPTQVSATAPTTPTAALPAANEELIAPTAPGGNHEILIIKRHPFGLVSMYLLAIIGLVGSFGLVFWLVPTALGGDAQTRVMSYLLILAVVATFLVGIFLVIATYIYRQNRWVVTDDSVHQVSQRGLFNRQTSELSMANIEDVTAEQIGVLAKLFGFGTLRAETAGELPYFHFNYCPHPEKYAQIIIKARESYIEAEPLQAKRANDLLNVPGGHPNSATIR